MSSFFDPVPPPQPRCAEPEWAAPRRNVLGAGVPLSILLAKTEEVAVSLGPIAAYPNGFELRVRIRLRRRDDDVHPVLMNPLRPAADSFRFGVQFSDGRKTTNAPTGFARGTEPEPPRLGMRGGSGSDGSWDSNYWIWGLPTPGPLAFVCSWAARELPETRAEIDAALVLDAVPQAIELWPDEG
jgi:hypothetical protein